MCVCKVQKGRHIRKMRQFFKCFKWSKIECLTEFKWRNKQIKEEKVGDESDKSQWSLD